MAHAREGRRAACARCRVAPSFGGTRAQDTSGGRQGVSIATAITLFIVPMLYRRLARGSQSTEIVTRKLRALIASRVGDSIGTQLAE